MKIAVLGGGKIGSVIAEMLSKEHDVTIVDPEGQTHNGSFMRYQEYLDEDIFDDLIVNALPGKIGFDALEMCVTAGKDTICVSFWEYDSEKVKALDEEAKKRGVTVLYDLGWSPGMTNILIGNAMAELGEVESVDYYVGGLPQSGPYKSPYCVEDSLKFAMQTEGGKLNTKKHLYAIKCAFERRSLPRPVTPFTYRPLEFEHDIKNMGRLGMFKPENLPHTTEILRNEWAIDENYRDISYMDIYVRNKHTTIEYHMIDKYGEELKMTSMAKLTATTAVLGVELLEKTLGIYGVIAPETLSRMTTIVYNSHLKNKTIVRCADYFWEGWKDAGIIIERTTINP